MQLDAGGVWGRYYSRRGSILSLPLAVQLGRYQLMVPLPSITRRTSRARVVMLFSMRLGKKVEFWSPTGPKPQC
jgi:hypothetical protein